MYTYTLHTHTVIVCVLFMFICIYKCIGVYIDIFLHIKIFKTSTSSCRTIPDETAVNTFEVLSV